MVGQRIAVRVAAPLLNAFDVARRTEGLTRSEATRLALEDYVASVAREDERRAVDAPPSRESRGAATGVTT